jgi:hypothetical protein
MIPNVLIELLKPYSMENRIMLPDEIISNKIYLIRNMKVMLDKDLAELYGVLTGNLNKSVKRNSKRFPEDFMFQLTKEEFDNLIFQFGTLSWGGTRRKIGLIQPAE